MTTSRWSRRGAGVAAVLVLAACSGVSDERSEADRDGGTGVVDGATDGDGEVAGDDAAAGDGFGVAGDRVDAERRPSTRPQRPPGFPAGRTRPRTDLPPPAPAPRPYTPLPDDLVLDRVLVAEAPDQVTALAVRPDDGRLFAADKRGRVWVVDGDGLRDDPFLDLSDRVLAGGQNSEQGLLSLAFHPVDAARLFVYYVTRGDDDTVLEEYRVDADGRHADPSSGRTIVAVPQPFRWHNGGHVAFGPDRMLWLSLGDGGVPGDPDLLAQDPTNLLGSLLRIDVDAAAPYGIPADNPFADGAQGAPEVWANGLRNPWSLAFDPVEWRVYVADVGQWRYEWVNVVTLDDGGANFGWPVLEGSSCFADHAERCPGEGFVDPAFAYPRGAGDCAIIGGHVYDGDALPAFAGHYVYTDFCAGWLRSFRYHDGTVRDERDWSDQVGRFDRPVTVAADADGELLVSDDLGAIWRIVPG